MGLEGQQGQSTNWLWASQRGLQSLQGDLLLQRPAAAACLEKPRFDELSTVEALTLLGPWVYNLGSASALGDMISEICPIFFTVSLCLSFLFQNNSVLVFFFFFRLLLAFFFFFWRVCVGFFCVCVFRIFFLLEDQDRPKNPRSKCVCIRFLLGRSGDPGGQGPPGAARGTKWRSGG